MRKLIWSVLPVAALALTACNHSSSQQAGDAAPDATSAQAANNVTGTITTRDPAQLSPAAKLEISLVDVSTTPGASPAPLATKTVSPVEKLPMDFQLDFSATDVKPDNLYVIKANLVDGDRSYTMALQAPVLTKGNSNHVTIQLVAQQTPAEKDLGAFDALKKQIGGMKIKSGTKLDKDVSRAWQVFRRDGQVQFIRAQSDYGDKGFTETDFAYKAGKPWVAVQQKKSEKNAKPGTTERVSWDVDGNAVLKQSVSGGNTTSLSDDEASSLKQQAVQFLHLAGSK